MRVMLFGMEKREIVIDSISGYHREIPLYEVMRGASPRYRSNTKWRGPCTGLTRKSVPDD
jgi:hypothetical protein